MLSSYIIGHFDIYLTYLLFYYMPINLLSPAYGVKAGTQCAPLIQWPECSEQ